MTLAVSRIEEELGSRSFPSTEMFIKAMEVKFKDLTKNGLDWNKCIVFKGGYAEKDHVDLDD